ncbi:hypothetical protein RIF29_39582 [Crotalaria pallida]|uniref:Uncharacterized protein n=1 Tax=Crotalaria pallida TaxID=3830 RepID=A0AAN9HPX0_CROPI
MGDAESYCSRVFNYGWNNGNHIIKVEAYYEVVNRLRELNEPEVDVPGFEDELWVHFNRLPTRYSIPSFYLSSSKQQRSSILESSDNFCASSYVENIHMPDQQQSDNTCILPRIILIIVLKTQDVYSARSVVIHIFGYALTGVRPKQDGVRIAVSFIKPEMEMGELNIKGLWFLVGLKR